MPRFAANLSMMFNEVPFLDRFDAAAKAGFTAVEFLFPYDHPAEAVGERLHRNGLTQALFNLPPGNWEAGEKGFAALPARFDAHDLFLGTDSLAPEWSVYPPAARFAISAVLILSLRRRCENVPIWQFVTESP